MSRRASLPGAAELFRATGPQDEPQVTVRSVSALPSPASTDPANPDLHSLSPDRREIPPTGLPATPRAGVRQTARRRARPGERYPSGRERHDEKITVYVSADELFDLEQARLVLRGEHGLALDRGRIVREALAVVIADLEARGESSTLVRRLRES
jgi:hypothetical protein